MTGRYVVTMLRVEDEAGAARVIEFLAATGKALRIVEGATVAIPATEVTEVSGRAVLSVVLDALEGAGQ